MNSPLDTKIRQKDAGQIIGTITYKERDELQALIEKKNGLTELVRSLVEENNAMLQNNLFYEKIIADLGLTVTKQQQWWDSKSEQYHWIRKAGYMWNVNFSTGEITLREP